MTPPVWRGRDLTSRVSRYQGMTPLVRRGLVYSSRREVPACDPSCREGQDMSPPVRRHQDRTPPVGGAKMQPPVLGCRDMLSLVESHLGLAPSSQEVPGHSPPPQTWWSHWQDLLTPVLSRASCPLSVGP